MASIRIELKKPLATSRGDETLSEYEQLRARNIARNNRRLRALGLISTKEETQSNSVASDNNSRRSSQIPCDSDKAGEDENWYPPIRRKKRRKLNAEVASRRSSRLRGKEPDGSFLKEGMVSASPSAIQQERKHRVRGSRDARLLRSVEEFNGETVARSAKQNPTATYEHCLMRVRTMSEDGLLNRVKAIERAAGKHSVVKMAIFKSCLEEEGLRNLARSAGDALERLQTLKPPP